MTTSCAGCATTGVSRLPSTAITNTSRCDSDVAGRQIVGQVLVHQPKRTSSSGPRQPTDFSARNVPVLWLPTSAICVAAVLSLHADGEPPPVWRPVGWVDVVDLVVSEHLAAVAGYRCPSTFTDPQVVRAGLSLRRSASRMRPACHPRERVARLVSVPPKSGAVAVRALPSAGGCFTVAQHHGCAERFAGPMRSADDDAAAVRRDPAIRAERLVPDQSARTTLSPRRARGGLRSTARPSTPSRPAAPRLRPRQARRRTPERCAGKSRVPAHHPACGSSQPCARAPGRRARAAPTSARRSRGTPRRRLSGRRPPLLVEGRLQLLLGGRRSGPPRRRHRTVNASQPPVCRCAMGRSLHGLHARSSDGTAPCRVRVGRVTCPADTRGRGR